MSESIVKSLAIEWYFDLVSPFAYLQLHSFDRLPGHVAILPRPVLLGAILKHWGQLGPAEIAPKRLHTYRITQFAAQQRGLPFRMPERHPFNPLKALRVLCANGPDIATTRRAFDFVFAKGRAPDTDEELMAFGRALELETDALVMAQEDAAKQRLRENTEEAIGRNVFGVPTFAVGKELFWGDDATDMLVAYLADPALFTKGEMARIATLPIGAQRSGARPG